MKLKNPHCPSKLLNSLHSILTQKLKQQSLNKPQQTFPCLHKTYKHIKVYFLLLFIIFCSKNPIIHSMMHVRLFTLWFISWSLLWLRSPIKNDSFCSLPCCCCYCYFGFSLHRRNTEEEMEYNKVNIYANSYRILFG